MAKTETKETCPTSSRTRRCPVWLNGKVLCFLEAGHALAEHQYDPDEIRKAFPRWSEDFVQKAAGHNTQSATEDDVFDWYNQARGEAVADLLAKFQVTYPAHANALNEFEEFLDRCEEPPEWAEKADRQASMIHDAIFAEPFDRQKASDEVWKLHEILRSQFKGVTNVSANPKRTSRGNE